MPAYFNQSSYNIYVPKEMAGETPFSTESPTHDISAHRPSETMFNAKNMALAGAAYTGAKAYGVIMTEIQASGNERLERNVKRATAVFGIGAGVLKFGAGKVLPAAIAYGAITRGITLFEQHRSNIRQGREMEHERELMGVRQRYTQGSAYYD